MSKTVYDYMDWPEIEAVVYGEETAPRDVMGPRLTPDGVLIQGFFPEARAAAVVTGRTKYEMELEDEAGYYAVLIPGRRIPDYEFQVEFEKETKNFKDAYAFRRTSHRERMKEPSLAAYIMKPIRKWAHIPW